MKRLLIFFFLFAFVATHAQPDQYWIDVNLSKSFQKKWTVAGETGIRFTQGTGTNAVYARTGLGCSITRTLLLQGGAAYFYYVRATDKDFHEVRPWQGIRHDTYFLSKRIDVVNYFRAEERFFNYKDSKDVFLLRLRYLTGFIFRLSRTEANSLYLPVYYEVFEDLNDHKTIFVNQQRLYFGIGYKLKNNKIEGFYIPRGNRTSEEQALDLSNNVWRVRWHTSL